MPITKEKPVTQAEIINALKELCKEVNLTKKNIRLDFSLMVAQAQANTILHRLSLSEEKE